MALSRRARNQLGTALALVVIVGVILVATLKSSSQGSPAFCATMQLTLGPDARALTNAINQGGGPGTYAPSNAQISKIRVVQKDLDTLLKESPPVIMTRWLFDYQIRLHDAVSALQVESAVQRFHAFSMVNMKTECPGVYHSLAG